MAEKQGGNTTGSNQITKYKIVFLGDQSVGKTSIINRFIYDTFTGSEQPTVGIDFVSKTLNLDNKTLRLQLWDTAGQERFRSLIPSYIRDSHAAIVVFDTTNAQSFQNVQKWVEDVKEERGSDVIIYLVGNKIDLENDRKVSTQEAEQKARELGACYAEVSASQGTNIPQFFQQLSHMLVGGGPTASEVASTATASVSVSQKKAEGGEGRERMQLKPEGDKTKGKKSGCC